MAFGACQGGAPSTSPPDASVPAPDRAPGGSAPPDARQTAELAADLVAESPQRRAAALAGSVTEVVGSSVLLPAGSTMVIDPATFQANGSDLATITAVVRGPAAGTWRLYVALEDGKWRVFLTERVGP